MSDELSNELKAKAKWCADLMRADGVTPEQITPELALAYFDEVGRKIQRIQTACLTRPEVRKTVNQFILQTINN
jgi:hypothetical protein